MIGRIRPSEDFGLLQDAFGGLVRKHFPEASELDMYGASIALDPDTFEPTSVSCCGRTVPLR